MAGHLLLDYPVHKGVEHQIGPPETPARMSPMQLADDRVVRVEGRWVVAESSDRAEAL
jgi:hypothetical protein